MKNYRILALLLLLTAVSFCSADINSNRKGKIFLQKSLLGYDYYYETATNDLKSVGFFVPDMLKEEVKSVPKAYASLSASTDKMWSGYAFAALTGAFIGTGLRSNGNKEVYITLGLVSFALSIISEINAQYKMYEGVYFYNEALSFNE